MQQILSCPDLIRENTPSHTSWKKIPNLSFGDRTTTKKSSMIYLVQFISSLVQYINHCNSEQPKCFDKGITININRIINSFGTLQHSGNYIQ